MRSMETRVEALEARQPAMKWHKTIAEVGEPVEAIRARLGIPDGDNLIIYRLVDAPAR